MQNPVLDNDAEDAEDNQDNKADKEHTITGSKVVFRLWAESK